MNVRHDMVGVFVVRPSADGASHEFLQLHRAAGDYLGGTWQIIRGGVDAGETYVAAALRELREEAGLAPVEFYRAPSVESFYLAADDTLWHSVTFCAFVDRDAVVQLNEEHDAFRWTPGQRMLDESMWASERAVLNDLFHDVLRDSAAKPHLRVWFE